MTLTRFAPSPTGHLHLGHAASANYVWQTAQIIGAPVRLRIEDIDHTRCRPEFEEGIKSDLAWLGLEWEGDIRRQSDHLEAYEETLAFLIDADLVYRCFKTRPEIEATRQAYTEPSAPYTGGPLPASKERSYLEAGKPYAWRLSLQAAQQQLGHDYGALSFIELGKDGPITNPVQPGLLGDVILARKDIQTSYHIACCHDDALQGITHVVRGEDLRDVTHIHVLLQSLMGWPQPKYQFHPLMMGPDGQKLSKRDQDKALHTFRSEGVTPSEIHRMTGFE